MNVFCTPSTLSTIYIYTPKSDACVTSISSRQYFYFWPIQASMVYPQGKKDMKKGKGVWRAGEEAQESKASEESWEHVALTIGVVVGAALLAWGVHSLFSSSSEDEMHRKLMKQPGRNGRWMYRDDFEANPRDYFRGLHEE
ncbi:hypothetical protein ACLOJK_038144 [Asimina triloba]